MSFQVKYIYDLVDKITPKLKNINNGFKAAASKASVAASKMSSSFDKVKRKLGDVGKKAGEVGRNLFLKTTVPITLLAGTFVKAASDYQESINKVDVAFGDASKSVKEFAKQAGADFGIDRGTALDMAAMFGDMSTSMGLSQTKASDLSQKLVGLAGDLASFKNIGVDQATTALAGVFTGETESLKRLGVVMTEQNLSQFALSKGIQKNIKDFSQAEKVLLRYQFVTQMTSNAQGDFLRTNEGFANQARILKSRFKDLSIQLGTILLPYALKLVKVAISLIEKFQRLSPTTQKAILIFAGLAAILPPLLIAFGLMSSGILAVGAAFAFLASPIGIIIAAITLLTLKWKGFREDLFAVVGFLTDVALGAFKKLGNIISGIGNFLGFGGSSDINSNLNQTQNINQRSDVNVGGQIQVNLANAPRGTKTQAISDNPNVPLGVNQVYSGG